MKEISLTANLRNERGKGSARRTRSEGKIPGIVYGPEIDPVSIAIDEKVFRSAIKLSTSGTIFNLDVDGKENKVVVRDIQRDPVTSRVIHVDFHAISMNRPINIAIPIKFIGIPRGVKTDGGIMNAPMRELEISCLPVNIPDALEIDVTDLGIGDSVHVKDLSIENVEILAEPQRTVVVISSPTVMKAEVTAAEGEVAEGEVAEGAAEGEGEAPAEGAEGAEGGKGAKGAKDEKKEEGKKK
ncbi:MAG: 50S ribosomal protein L25 [candidate division Zixibacteria bacterium]|nr:50S ribosomal protein L25 [candidate division Zixibacteria bacterium]